MSAGGDRRELTVRSPSGPLLAAWERGPADGRAVVLLHGLTMTGDHVLTTTRALERAGFRVVSFDARGHGRSQRALDLEGYGYDVMIEDLATVMDAFGVERAVLAGCSMGAHTALRFALRAPRRVAAIAAISPAFDPDRHPRADQVEDAEGISAAIRADGLDGFVAALAPSAEEAPESLPLTAGTVLTRRRLEQHRDMEAVGDALRSNLRSRPFDSLVELRTIDVPALVVGSHDGLDSRHPYDLARAYARELEGSRFESEEPGRPPLGWGGRRLTALVVELAERAHWHVEPVAGRPAAAGSAL